MLVGRSLFILGSVCCSVFGLFLIYFASIHQTPNTIEISDLNFDYLGRVVKIDGTIVNKRIHPSGHIFLTLSDGKNRIEVPIFAALATQLEENGITDHLGYKDSVTVTGTVAEYNRKLQIVPRKVSDISADGRIT